MTKLVRASFCTFWYEHRFSRPYPKAIEEETTGHELAEGEAVVETAELRRMHEAMERMQVQV